MDRTRATVRPSVRCHQCSMVFNSIEHLSKHREKFCVGPSITVKHERHRLQVDPRVAEEKVRQLHALKEANSRRNDENYLRDSMLLSSPSLQVNQKEANQQLQKQVNKLHRKHDRQLTDLRAHGENLQKSRNDIESKIAALKRGFDNRQNLVNREARGDNADYLSMLEDLKNQINSLRKNRLRNQPVHTTVERQLPVMAAQQPDKQVRHGPDFHFTGGSLVAEISALRQYYISTGGRDPAIVSQLNDMLKDAEEVEKFNRLPTKVPPAPVDGLLPEELVAVELENYRLQRELLQAQGPPFPLTDGLASRLHLERMLALERQIELAKHQAFLDGMKKEDKTFSSTRPYYQRLANIASSGYNPEQGFVCFYDFAMGLEAEARVCRLVVGLYDGGTELGQPSLLPTVYTELSPGGNTAMIGARQPVPRCQASKNMYLMVELQTSDTTPDELYTKAWLKLDLFTSSLSLHSGAWKLTFHELPIKPHMPTSELSLIPRYKDAILYTRIVHQRDSLTQSETVISAANCIDYQYPPVTSRHYLPQPDTTPTSTYSWS